MNNMGVAGILRMYAEKAARATDTKHLRKIVVDLISELDLRRICMKQEDK